MGFAIFIVVKIKVVGRRADDVGQFLAHGSVRHGEGLPVFGEEKAVGACFFGGAEQGTKSGFGLAEGDEVHGRVVPHAQFI